MSDWQLTQLSHGTDQGRFHSHSYYDIPVIDAAGRYVLAHRMTFAERPITAEDSVEVGLLDAEAPGEWTPVATTHAWSWQQGPMAQWVAGGPRFVFNDREGDRFVARVFDGQGGEVERLPMPLYTVSADGTFGLGCNMGRLDTVRPGYGYAGSSDARLSERRPKTDGVWRVPMDGSAPQLVLSLARAVKFTVPRLAPKQLARVLLQRVRFWFNHIKLSPDGTRFTVKLRWSPPGKGWGGHGVSLTCNVDGSNLALLADKTSHVIWLNDHQLYMWRAGELALFEDARPRGRRIGRIATGVVEANVHARHIPPGPTEALGRMVFDTPYREEIDLRIFDARTGEVETIAHFTGHRPRHGNYRCDLHPCPSPEGRRIIVTSLQDGGRQVYLLSAD